MHIYIYIAIYAIKAYIDIILYIYFAFPPSFLTPSLFFDRPFNIYANDDKRCAAISYGE